ncbi:MAG: flavin oxidoreductase [Microbacterium sp. 67-17]|nr:MAG: flavin oxidoreductase [Microbacterium sp. 67-17]
MTCTAAADSLPLHDNATNRVSVEQFKAAFRHHPGGVAVITADDGTRPVAMTATSVSSVSADPPLLLFSVSELSSSAPTLLASQSVVVHLIDATTSDIAKLGATSKIDRFADTSMWHRLPTGEPVFHDVSVWLRCRPVRRFRAGNATIVIAEAIEAHAQVDDPRDGLAYVNRTWHRLSEHSQLAD